MLSIVIQKKPSLGLGNIIGATIGNVLGAFAIVLVLHGDRINFDRGARVFALVSFLMTTMFCFLTLKNNLGIQGGILLVVAFTVYIFSIGSAVYEGMIQPHHLVTKTDTKIHQSLETAFDESSSSSSSDGENEYFRIRIFPSVMHCHPTEDPALLLGESSQQELSQTNFQEHHFSDRRTAQWDLNLAANFVLGVLALCLAGFVATYSVAAIAAALGISEYLAGMAILSFVTPIPERLLKFSYTRRLHSDLLMASTAGTNIVLLTLGMGIIVIAGSQNGHEVISGDVIAAELWICWACSFFLLLLSWIGGRPS